MSYSRRDLAVLLPALAAVKASGQTEKTIPSTVYRYEDLPVRASGPTRQRQTFNGANHAGFHVDLHLTELAPGEMPHAPHHHVHEEIVMLRKGTLEVTINEKVTRAGAGSVVYVASGEQHGWRNVGSEPAEYFVIALGRDS
jgi:quercetin dioxygenase-like cupin family protein